MSATTTVTNFETLFGIDKAGRTKSWSANVVLNDDNTATANVTFGLLTGKKQTTTRNYTVGKNIGKSNETTPYEQAVSETQSKWKDKNEKEGYTTTEPSANATQKAKAEVESDDNEEETKPTATSATTSRKILPMLAHVYEPGKPKNRIEYPCYVQPKLDGVRCVCYLSPDGTTVLSQSRVGSYFSTVGHITSDLLGPFQTLPELAGGVVLDGELYTDSMPFEELVGLVKKKTITPQHAAKLLQVSYHVYDIIIPANPEAAFMDRYKVLKRVVKATNSPHIKLVNTQVATKVPEFRSFFAMCVEEGYEGVMLRNMNGKYQCNYRSHDLQKYKEFFEEEYEICGYKEAEGRDKGTVVWVCKLPGESGAIFNVRPKGTLEMRRQWFVNAESHIGQKLTVVYQELSEMGVPRFPIGKCLRNGY
jgi:ATP-dependent DNA ligase